jgi:hypothetical protein
MNVFEFRDAKKAAKTEVRWKKPKGTRSNAVRSAISDTVVGYRAARPITTRIRDARGMRLVHKLDNLYDERERLHREDDDDDTRTDG